MFDLVRLGDPYGYARETISISEGQLLKSSDGMEYFYGGNGVMGFVYSGNKYVYRKNLQGDATILFAI